MNSTLGIESNYVNLQFLPICFKFVKYKIAAEKELVDGDWCTVLEAPKGVDKIWIDTNHGYLIRKRILKRPIYRTAPGQLAWVRNTNAKLDQVAEGIWLPRKMISEEFTEAPPGDTELWEPRRTQTVTARSIEVGGPLPDEQYLIAFPAGTIVDTDYHYGRAASRFVAKGDETRFDEIGNLIRSNSDVEQEVGPDPSNAGKPGSQAAWGTMDYLPCNFDRTWRDWCVLILTCNFWLAIGVAGFFVFRRFVRESRKRKTDVAKS